MSRPGGAERAEAFRLTPLVPDTGCGRSRHWACHIEGRPDVATLAGCLEANGLHRRCDHPALGVFRHSRGHEIAWVTATGRIQIRVDIEVPRSERPATAARLYRSLAGALASKQSARSNT